MSSSPKWSGYAKVVNYYYKGHKKIKFTSICFIYYFAT